MKLRHKWRQCQLWPHVPQKHPLLGEFAHHNVLAASTTSVVERQYMQPKTPRKE
jgi:hypothetical protein